MDWPSEQPPPYALGGNHSAYVESDGRVVLQIRKVYERPAPSQDWASMGLVVEADGPVRQAFWRDYYWKSATQVVLDMTSVAPGKSSWRFVEWIDGSHRVAPFGGDDTLLRPPILSDRLQSDPQAASALVGADFYLEISHSMRVFRWDGTDMGVAAHGTGAYWSQQWVGRTLLFALSSSPNYRVLRWTEHDGTRVLVGFAGDDSKGAATPGSDGMDLVWVQGEGLEDGSSIFPERWIMTSKYSTDPSEIQPRRLIRWLETPITSGEIPPPVGCGYAAFRYTLGFPIGTEMGLLIVRLSDGISWTLPSPSLSPPDTWLDPIAITCDEVFARYKGGYLETIRRVRLDSLGPGTPPSEYGMRGR